MTDDLVKRLRRGEYDVQWAKHIPTEMTEEAADRIEKLEAALREIAALGYWDGDSAMSIARKAAERDL